jgi:hypothetical protein
MRRRRGRHLTEPGTGPRHGHAPHFDGADQAQDPDPELPSLAPVTAPVATPAAATSAVRASAQARDRLSRRPPLADVFIDTISENHIKRRDFLQNRPYGL